MLRRSRFGLGISQVLLIVIGPLVTHAQVIGLDARNGFDAAYNLMGSEFSGFRSRIAQLGFSVVPLTAFTDSDLGALDALVLLQPYSAATAYSSAEVSAILGFASSHKGMLVLGDAGGGSDATFLDPVSAPFGVSFADTGTDQAGHIISAFVEHPLTFGLSTVGVDYQRRLQISGNARDLTLGAGADDFLAVSGRAVFVSDSGMFSDEHGGADADLAFGSNALLLDRAITYIAVPEPKVWLPGATVGLLGFALFRRVIGARKQSA